MKVLPHQTSGRLPRNATVKILTVSYNHISQIQVGFLDYEHHITFKSSGPGEIVSLGPHVESSRRQNLVLTGAGLHAKTTPFMRRSPIRLALRTNGIVGLKSLAQDMMRSALGPTSNSPSTAGDPSIPETHRSAIHTSQQA